MSQRQTKFLTLRVTEQLDADLRKVAEKEANSESAVARRLLAKGLSRELRGDRQQDRDR